MSKKKLYVLNICISIFVMPLFLLRKKIAKKKIWLCGAGNGLYENNIAVFHDYILKNTPNDANEIYFITTDLRLIADNLNFNILKRGTVKSYVLSIIADYLIFDTCNSDIAPGIHRFIGGFKVNVNHGFEGLKKLPLDYYANIDADVHCASSEQEKTIKVALCGAPINKVYITGYPRFDKISLGTGKKIKTILFFPTWRPWLESLDKNELKQSHYVRSIFDFISDNMLNEYLVNNGITLLYKPHHKIKHLELDSLPLSNIKILNENDDLTDFIRNADVLITDYSSVTWDFVYNDRKVLFYLFDIERYVEQQGLYYDVRVAKEINNCRTAQELVELTIKSCDGYAGYSKIMANDFFKFRDNKNCERILALIREKQK